jgi:hypothetical protein
LLFRGFRLQAEVCDSVASAFRRKLHVLGRALTPIGPGRLDGALTAP